MEGPLPRPLQFSSSSFSRLLNDKLDTTSSEKLHALREALSLNAKPKLRKSRPRRGFTFPTGPGLFHISPATPRRHGVPVRPPCRVAGTGPTRLHQLLGPLLSCCEGAAWAPGKAGNEHNEARPSPSRRQPPLPNELAAAHHIVSDGACAGSGWEHVPLAPLQEGPPRDSTPVERSLGGASPCFDPLRRTRMKAR